MVFSREIRSYEKQCHAAECNHEMLMRVRAYVFSLNEIIPRGDVIIDVIVIGVELRDNMRFPGNDREKLRVLRGPSSLETCRRPLT